MGEAHTRTTDDRMHRSFGRIIQQFILAVIVVLGGTGFAPAAFAQSASDKVSITMSPASSKFTIDAGATKSDKLIIINDGAQAYDFLVYARPYSINGNDYSSPNFTTTKANTDLYGWVQIPQTKYHLEAGKSVEVPYTINVPAGAAPGGHYGVVFAEVQPASAPSNSNSILAKKRIGSIIYATVNGKLNLSGAVAAGAIPFWQVQPPLEATVASTNSGNTDYIDTATLKVSDIFGTTKYQLSQDYHVLPDTTRTVDLQWKDAPWFGLFKVEAEQKFLDKDVTNSGYVLLMPRYIPVVLLVLILIGGGYAVARRRKK